MSSGSQGHPTQFGPNAFRQAVATAREALFDMAARQLNTTVDPLMVENGIIMMRSNRDRQVSYGQLIGGRTTNLTINAAARPKHPSTYHTLGLSVLRLDLPAKATGEFRYTQNVRLPGMLHGRVVRPPRPGAKVISATRRGRG